MKLTYSMVIQWSDEDQAYLVTLPEFGGCQTHGQTYSEATRMAEETIGALIQVYQTLGRPLPEPLKFGSPVSISNELAMAKTTSLKD